METIIAMSFEAFFVVTPTVLTSSGRLAVATATLFCTLTESMSPSDPVSNVTVRL